MPVTATHRPGLVGYVQPEGTAGWMDGPDGEWLTTDPPAPGMVVVDWVDATRTERDYLWEYAEHLLAV